MQEGFFLTSARMHDTHTNRPDIMRQVHKSIDKTFKRNSKKDDYKCDRCTCAGSSVIYPIQQY